MLTLSSHRDILSTSFYIPAATDFSATVSRQSNRKKEFNDSLMTDVHGRVIFRGSINFYDSRRDSRCLPRQLPRFYLSLFFFLVVRPIGAHDKPIQGNFAEAVFFSRDRFPARLIADPPRAALRPNRQMRYPVTASVQPPACKTTLWRSAYLLLAAAAQIEIAITSLRARSGRRTARRNHRVRYGYLRQAATLVPQPRRRGQCRTTELPAVCTVPTPVEPRVLKPRNFCATDNGRRESTSDGRGNATRLPTRACILINYYISREKRDTLVYINVPCVY